MAQNTSNITTSTKVDVRTPLAINVFIKTIRTKKSSAASYVSHSTFIVVTVVLSMLAVSLVVGIVYARLSSPAQDYSAI